MWLPHSLLANDKSLQDLLFRVTTLNCPTKNRMQSVYNKISFCLVKGNSLNLRPTTPFWRILLDISSKLPDFLANDLIFCKTYRIHKSVFRVSSPYVSFVRRRLSYPKASTLFLENLKFGGFGAPECCKIMPDICIKISRKVNVSGFHVSLADRPSRKWLNFSQIKKWLDFVAE